MMRRIAPAVIALSFAFHAADARAEGSSDKVAAETLFDEGRSLMTAGRHAEACPKFEASQRLDPGVGTMLYLADCYEKTGRTASAWAEFREAVSAAHNSGSLDREKVAGERARALEPKLSRLTVNGAPGPDVVVTRDGVKLDPAELGTAVPVDPGTHVVAATAPSKRKWTTNVEVAAGGARVSLAIPILTDDEVAPAVSPAVPAATPAPAPAPAPSPPPGSAGGLGTQRTFAIVAGGVGVVGLAVGTAFGFMARSEWNDAKAHCAPYPYCGAEGADHAASAKTKADLSTALFIVGGVGLATGAVLWFTAPGGGESGVGVGIGPGAVIVGGRM